MNKLFEQLMYGSLLGDGAIHKDKQTGKYRYAESHSDKQKTYLEWKSGFFDDHVSFSEMKGRGKVRNHEWYDSVWCIKHLDSKGNVLWQESKHNDLVDEGERSIIMSYFRAEELPTAFYARLAYDSISLTDSLSDVQNEPSGNGYDPIILERSSVGFPTIQQDAGDWRVVSKQITFTATVGNWGKVNVLFLATTSDNLGKLIACVPLTMTRVMNAGDSLVATIRIKLR